MNATPKVWGLTTPLISTPMFEMHRLQVKPGFRCSMHRHRTKHNAFFVLSGAIIIDTIEGDFGGRYTETRLQRGDCFTVAPGIHHQFRTEADGDGCTLLEVYYTEPLSEDIVRLNVGGPI